MKIIIYIILFILIIPCITLISNGIYYYVYLYQNANTTLEQQHILAQGCSMYGLTLLIIIMMLCLYLYK
jgi:hypothetical protein